MGLLGRLVQHRQMNLSALPLSVSTGCVRPTQALLMVQGDDADRQNNHCIAYLDPLGNVPELFMTPRSNKLLTPETKNATQFV